LILAISGIILSVGAALSKKISYTFWYDMLACCILLTWFSYWQQFFNKGAPMFFFFPLFFAVMVAFVDFKFINKKAYFDLDSIETIKFYSQLNFLNPVLIISALLISILIPQHFLLFPVLMNALIVRYTITNCLDRN
jgi:hypothetical protein